MDRVWHFPDPTDSEGTIISRRLMYHVLNVIYMCISFWYLKSLKFKDKETSFLDLDIKVIGNNIQISVYDKRDDYGFPIVNIPWLSGDVPRLPSYGIFILQFDLLDVVLAFN